MGFAAPFIPQIIGAAVGGAKSLFGGGRDNQSRSSSQTPNIPPESMALFRQLTAQAGSDLSNPGSDFNFQGVRNQGVSTINRATDAGGKRLETNLAGRGFGRSGLVAKGKTELETNRVNAIGTLDQNLLTEIERIKREEKQQRFSNALQLVPQNFGSTSSQTGSSGQGFDPFDFLSPFLETKAFNRRGGGGGSSSVDTSDFFGQLQGQAA